MSNREWRFYLDGMINFVSGLTECHEGQSPIRCGNMCNSLKWLDKVKTGNKLRDHMTDLELIFTMLGEAGTTEIARRKDAQGFVDNCKAAKEGGAVAGNARKALEANSGKSVVSKENYLSPSRNKLERK